MSFADALYSHLRRNRGEIAGLRTESSRLLNLILAGRGKELVLVDVNGTRSEWEAGMTVEDRFTAINQVLDRVEGRRRSRTQARIV